MKFEATIDLYFQVRYEVNYANEMIAVFIDPDDGKAYDPEHGKEYPTIDILPWLNNDQQKEILAGTSIGDDGRTKLSEVTLEVTFDFCYTEGCEASWDGPACPSETELGDFRLFNQRRLPQTRNYAALPYILINPFIDREAENLNIYEAAEKEACARLYPDPPEDRDDD